MFKVLSCILSYWTDEKVKQKWFCDLLKIIVLTWRNKDWNSDLITSYTLCHRHSSLFEFGKDWSLFNLFSTEPAASSLFPTLPFQAGPLPCILGSKLLGFVQCFGQSAVCHRYDWLLKGLVTLRNEKTCFVFWMRLNCLFSSPAFQLSEWTWEWF